MKITSPIKHLLIGLLLTATLVTAADKDLFLLPGDINNVYMSTVFPDATVTKNTKKGLGQTPATFKTDNAGAVVSNVREISSDLFSTSTQTCTNAKTYVKTGGEIQVALGCEQKVTIYDLDDENKLVVSATEFDTPTPIADFWYDADTGSSVTMSINANAATSHTITMNFNPAGETAYSVEIAQPDSPIDSNGYFANYIHGDGETPEVFTNFHVLYERAIDLSKSSANYIYWIYPGTDAATATQGKIELTAANEFPVDATHIVDISFASDDVMFVTYKEAAEEALKVAYCFLAPTVLPAAVAFVIDSCGDIRTPPVLSNGSITLKNDLRTNPGEVLAFNSDTNIISKCVYDGDGVPEITDCVVSEAVTVSAGHSFYYIQIGAMSNQILFKATGSADPIKSQIILYRLREIEPTVGNKLIVYDEISDRNGVITTATDLLGLIFTANSYSVYGADPNKYYVSFIADIFTAAIDVIITREQAGEEPREYTFNVQVLATLNTGAQIFDLINYQNYNAANLRLPFSRSMFFGNNLDYQFSVPELTTFNNNEFTFDISSLGDKVYFISDKHGLGVATDNTVTRFDCTGSHMTNDYACALNNAVSYVMDVSFEVLYVASTDNAAAQGIVLVAKNTDSIAFVHFGISETNVYPRIELFEPTGPAYFTLIGTAYNFLFAEGAKVTIYKWESRNFGLDFETVDITNVTAGKSLGNFCPKTIAKNLLIDDQVIVDSHCTGGESRAYTFKQTAPETFTFELVNSKNFNNPEAGSGDLDLCSFGNEFLGFNPATNYLFSTDIEDDYSLNSLDTAAANYAKITGIHCVRGAALAVITGENDGDDAFFSVIYGNKLGDPRERYHSTNALKGTIVSVTQASFGVLIRTLDDTTTYLYAVYLKGPFVFFNGTTPPAEIDATVTILQSGTQAAQKTFKLTITDYVDDLKVETKDNNKSAKGTYNLFELATITGDVYKITVSTGSETGFDVKLSDRYIVDATFDSKKAENLPEPHRFVTEGEKTLGLFNTGTESLKILLYEDYDQYDSMYDTTLTCSQYDAAIHDNYLLAVCGSTVAGASKISFYTKRFGSAEQRTGDIQTNIRADKLVLKEITTNKYALYTINQTTNQGQFFLLDVVADGLEYTVNTTPGPIFQNVYSAGILSLSNVEVALFYTQGSQAQLKSSIIGPDGTLGASADVTLPTNLEITALDCNTIEGKDDTQLTCLISYNSNTILDVIFAYNEASKVISVETSKSFSFYKNFKPMYTTFDEKWIVMKARSTDTETILVYSRARNTPSSLYWGLDPKDYYNIEAQTFTPSTPFIFGTVVDDVAKTNFRFTQSTAQTVTKKRILRGSKNAEEPVFKGMEETEVVLTLGTDISKEQALEVSIVFNGGASALDTIKFDKFFTENVEPEPTPTPPTPKDDPDVPWWVWVIIGMVVFLILITILLRFLTKVKEEEEEEDFYYGSDGKQQPENGKEEEEK